MNKTLFNALIYKKNFQFIYKLFKGIRVIGRCGLALSFIRIETDGQTDRVNTIQYSTVDQDLITYV